MYPLLETIRIHKNRAENLSFHQQRMDTSYAEVYATDNPFRLEEIIDAPQIPSDKIFKCRLLYGKNDYSIRIEPYSPKKINSLKIVHTGTLDYHLKYADRRELNNLVQQKSFCDDVLIVKHGLVTDTSYANIAFFNGHHWYTPEPPLLNGTKRQMLIEKEVIIPKKISPADLSQYKGFRIVNAMLVFKHQPIVPIKHII
ncbi:MAG: aminotransferase class IV [Bacteroidales bacterium]